MKQEVKLRKVPVVMFPQTFDLLVIFSFSARPFYSPMFENFTFYDAKMSRYQTVSNLNDKTHAQLRFATLAPTKEHW